jgi:hypothetical protein
MLMGILHTSGRAAMRGVANGGCMKKETNKKKSGATKDATPTQQQQQQQQQQAHRGACKRR